uniref:glycoside hydrolase family 18 n=1 Tax=Pedobacter schmidteae TaxID=2201271 RepID=UPI000EACC5BF|nr:glycoside hydrolase family 18 [Pedobacter schmidteae]
MKRLIFNYILPLLVAMAGISCKKQNTPEALVLQKPYVSTEEYLANLRAYKKSKHQIAFGWLGGSGGDGKFASMGKRWESVPDSMDIVSLWGGIPTEGSPQMAAMRFAQEQKGIRVTQVNFISGFDALIKKNFSSLAEQEGVDAMAKAVADTIAKYKLNGLDIDYEPGEASERNSIFARTGGLERLIKAFSPYFGPKSGTGKLLIVDGYMTSGVADYIDYYVSQAYATGSGASLQSRYNTAASYGIPPGKFVVTENFESYWSTGGVNYTDNLRGVIPSLLGMAYWQPTQGKKGGCGSYHMEYEYPQTPEYKYMRQAIQIMNPAVY